MFDHAHEPVGGGEDEGILFSDVPMLAQLLQSHECVGCADLLVRAPVDQLEQLCRELHIAQASTSQLDLSRRLGCRDEIDHATAHRADAVDEPLTAGGLPHKRQERLDELFAHPDVTGHWPSLEESLELPVLRNVRVVAGEFGHRAHQCPGLALGTQCRVNLPQRWLRAGIGEDAAHSLGNLRGQIALLITRRRIEDEDHVDVGDVVELARPGLAQGDHSDAHRALRIELCPGDGQSCIHGSGCQVREHGHHMIDDLLWRLGDEIIGDQPQLCIAIGATKIFDRLLAEVVRRGCRIIRIGTHTGQQIVAQRCRRGRGSGDHQERRPLHQLRQGLRMPHEVVDHRLGRAHDCEHPSQQSTVDLILGELCFGPRTDGIEELRRGLTCGLQDPQQTQGGRVRIRCRLEEIDEA